MRNEELLLTIAIELNCRMSSKVEPPVFTISHLTSAVQTAKLQNEGCFKPTTTTATANSTTEQLFCIIQSLFRFWWYYSSSLAHSLTQGTLSDSFQLSSSKKCKAAAAVVASKAMQLGDNLIINHQPNQQQKLQLSLLSTLH